MSWCVNTVGHHVTRVALYICLKHGLVCPYPQIPGIQMTCQIPGRCVVFLVPVAGITGFRAGRPHVTHQAGTFRGAAGVIFPVTTATRTHIVLVALNEAAVELRPSQFNPVLRMGINCMAGRAGHAALASLQVFAVTHLATCFSAPDHNLPVKVGRAGVHPVFWVRQAFHRIFLLTAPGPYSYQKDYSQKRVQLFHRFTLLSSICRGIENSLEMFCNCRDTPHRIPDPPLLQFGAAPRPIG